MAVRWIAFLIWPVLAPDPELERRLGATPDGGDVTVSISGSDVRVCLVRLAPWRVLDI